MKKKDIFISYKAEEIDKADELRLFLENKGFTCWMAPMSISGGASYASEIPSAIRNCKIYLLILSEAAQKSKWIPRELDQAINDEKVILPFVIEKCTLNDEFAFYLANVQRYEAWENKEKAQEKLLNEIIHLLRPPVPIDDNEGNEEEEKDKKEKGKIEENEETKEKKQKRSSVKRKKERKKPESKTLKKILLGSFSIILILFSCYYFFFAEKTITIAGKEIGEYSTSIYLHDVTLTEQDFIKMSNMEELRRIQLSNCTLPSRGDKLILNEELYYLELVNCNISDAFLADLNVSLLTKLDTLNLNGNKDFTDLSLFESNYSSMKNLAISDTSIKDPSLLANFTELRTLQADGLGLENIEFLSNFENLKNITLNRNHLKNLNGLEKNIRLETIEARENQIESLDGLTNATILSSVNLNHNMIKDISILEKSASSLKYMYIMDNNITDLSPLKDANQILHLNADHNKITSIEPLNSCILLKSISLAGNQLSDVKGIEHFSDLSYIDVSFNHITDISSLENTKIVNSNDIIINISNNQITELKLPMNKKIRGLYIQNNPIHDYEVLKDVSINKMVFDYDKDVDYNTWKEYDITVYYMLGQPLDQQLKLEEILGKYSVEFIHSVDEVNITQNFNYDILTGEK